MTRYARTPAIIVLLITTLIGVAYSVTAGRLARSKANAGDSLEFIENALISMQPLETSEGKEIRKKCLVWGNHEQARVIARVQRFVLNGNRIDRNTFFLHFLYITHKVFSVSIVVFRF